jgi:hypothetical protein
MIPQIHGGTPHNRALLEEMLMLLAQYGFDIALLYGAEVAIDILISDLLALFKPPQTHPVSWWNKFIYVGRGNGRGRK